MAFEFDWEKAGVPEIVEAVTAVIVAPVILPVAAAVKQPIVQTAIKGGIALSERCKEAVAEVGETIENLAAEVQTELVEAQQAQFKSPTTKAYFTNGKSEVAKDLINVASGLNSEVGRMTNNLVDLRLLLPLGLSALALKQLMEKGLQIEEIPWYALAWYAFDSFIKLNDEKESQLPEVQNDS
jgi:Protein of unknown function (DUF5132)